MYIRVKENMKTCTREKAIVAKFIVVVLASKKHIILLVLSEYILLHCSSFFSDDVKQSHFTCTWQLIRKQGCVNISFCKALEWSWKSCLPCRIINYVPTISILISYFWLWLACREIQTRKAERNGIALLLFFSFKEWLLQMPFMVPDMHISWMDISCELSRKLQGSLAISYSSGILNSPRLVPFLLLVLAVLML